jgi:hypothetical protein
VSTRRTDRRPRPMRIGSAVLRFDNAYRRNLIDVLIGSGTLSRADLRLLGPAEA